jgi:hypothetical protein
MRADALYDAEASQRVRHLSGRFVLTVSLKSVVVGTLSHGLFDAVFQHFYQPDLTMGDLNFQNPQPKFRLLS